MYPARQHICEANDSWGKPLVREVIDMVETIGDPDAVYTAYQGMEEDDKADIVEYLYFRND